MNISQVHLEDFAKKEGYDSWDELCSENTELAIHELTLKLLEPLVALKNEPRVNPFKVKLWVSEDPDAENPDATIFKDMFLDVNQITGFYIPDREPDNIDEDGRPIDGITLFAGGGVISVKSEEHIKDYLYDNFVVKAKKR
tara:strand:+ start:14715 stop:15137 length:423 start_codon:yes stop_codon:yes gene_type:complete